MREIFIDDPLLEKFHACPPAAIGPGSKVRRVLVGILTCVEGFRISRTIIRVCSCHFCSRSASDDDARGARVAYGGSIMDILKIACEEVRQELANYMEEDVPAGLRQRIENHFLTCDGCYAIYDGLRKIVRLIGSNDVIELPSGFSRRLYQRIVGVRRA